MRGTPQQIIDKYNQLARDAQLSGDRVATENFQQHAEHYLRLLGEAQKEVDARREEQERQNRERQAERDRERAARQEQRDAAEAASEAQPSNVPGAGEQPDVIETSEEPVLVETPEDKPKSKPKRPRTRKPRAPKGDEGSQEPTQSGDDTPEAAE